MPEYFLRYDESAVEAGQVTPDGCLIPGASGGALIVNAYYERNYQVFNIADDITPSEILNAALDGKDVLFYLEVSNGGGYQFCRLTECARTEARFSNVHFSENGANLIVSGYDITVTKDAATIQFITKSIAAT